MLINAIATCESFLGSPDNPQSNTTESSKGNFMTNDKKLPLVKLDFLNSQHNCENGFWDPLAGRCYNTSCGYHYQFQNGHCIFRNISQSLPCPQKNEFRWWEVRYNFFFWLLCPFVQVFLFSKRELSNGSIFHKRHKTLFNREDYEIYHFQVGESSRGYFDRVYKVCSTESLINVSIIQGAKKTLALFIFRSQSIDTF